MSKIITAAARTTSIVEERVTFALDTLDGNFSGRVVNGYGIYSDPERQKRALVTAIGRLKEALERMQDTAWPSGEDYDAA